MENICPKCQNLWWIYHEPATFDFCGCDGSKAYVEQNHEIYFRLVRPVERYWRDFLLEQQKEKPIEFFLKNIGRGNRTAPSHKELYGDQND